MPYCEWIRRKYGIFPTVIFSIQTGFFIPSRLLKSKEVREYLSAAKRVKEKSPETEFFLFGKCETKIQDAVSKEEVKNGFLVPIEDAEKLAECMMKFITHPESIEQMGKRSIEICEEKFEVKKVNYDMIKIMKLEV